MTLMERMIHYAPDEGGGEGAVGDAGEGGAAPAAAETFEVDGEQLTRDEVIKRASNEKKLAGEFTRAAQERAELKGRVDELSRQRNQPSNAEPTPEPEPDFDKMIAELDTYDDANYKTKLGSILKQQREWVAKEIARAQESTTATALSNLSASERANAINRANEATFAAVLADRERVPVDLTAEERTALYADFQLHVGSAYGEWDPTARVLKRNERAVEAALFSVPSVRGKIIAFREAKARQAGIEATARGQDATRSGPGSSPRPSGRGVTFEQQLEWYAGASEAEQGEYRRSNPDFIDKFIAYDQRRKRAGK